MILDVDPKMKKKKGEEWFALGEDLDEAWILEHQAFLVQEQRTKIEKKFQKDNEKLVQQGEKEMKAKELAERMEAASDLEKKFKKENKTKKVEAEGKSPSVERLEAAIQKIDERIAAMQLQAEDREGNKEVALGTSKIVSLETLPLTIEILISSRTILILALRLSSPRNLTYRSKSSFPKLCAKNSTGPSSLSKTPMTGSFKYTSTRCEARE
jgi:DNA topoisomerase-1